MSSLPSSSSSSGGTGETALPFWVDSSGTWHEPYRVLVLVGSKLLGEFSLDTGAHPELHWRRHGAAYFCPECGDIWARLVFFGARGERKPLDVERVACEKHFDQWEVAGSLLAGDLENLLPFLPPAAVQREFEIHLKRSLA